VCCKPVAEGGAGVDLRIEGRRRIIKLKATYTWQMINGVGRCLFFIIFLFIFMAFFCVSQQGEFKNTIKKLFGESTCQKLLAEKVEIFCLFSLSSLPSAFVRFSTRGVQKHHKTLFGGKTCQKLLAEKVEEKKLFSFRLFPPILFYRVFGRFSA
jgi:hypothetical protein